MNAGNVLTDTLTGISITDTIAVTAFDMNADGLKDQYDGHESWFTNAIGKPIPNFSAAPTLVCAGHTVFLLIILAIPIHGPGLFQVVLPLFQVQKTPVSFITIPALTV